MGSSEQIIEYVVNVQYLTADFSSMRNAQVLPELLFC